MITDSAKDAIKVEVDTRGLNEGVLSTALLLYLRDYNASVEHDPKLSQRSREASLLTPTAIKNIVEQAHLLFRQNAKDELRIDRLKDSAFSSLWSIALGVIANIIFVFLSIIFVLSAQNTAANFFESLGFSVKPNTSQSQTSNPSTHPSQKSDGVADTPERIK